MRIQMTMMVALAVAALACGDRSEQRSEAESQRMESRREVAPPAPEVSAPREAPAPTASDQPENAADRELIAAIRQQLMADDSLSAAGQNVTIVSESGNVTLRGQVENAEEKSRIEATARQAPGVGQIDNQIEVAAQ
jgi:osmotically-inducible protein OsmY